MTRNKPAQGYEVVTQLVLVHRIEGRHRMDLCRRHPGVLGHLAHAVVGEPSLVSHGEIQEGHHRGAAVWVAGDDRLGAGHGLGGPGHEVATRAAVSSPGGGSGYRTMIASERASGAGDQVIPLPPLC